jgi:hypothetical protein
MALAAMWVPVRAPMRGCKAGSTRRTTMDLATPVRRSYSSSHKEDSVNFLQRPLRSPDVCG